jgi:hypothetical protein
MSWVDDFSAKMSVAGLGQSYRAMKVLAMGLAAELRNAGADHEEALQMTEAFFGIWTMENEALLNWENVFKYWVDQYYRRKLWRK